MTHSSLQLNRRRWATIFFGAGVLAIGACSSLSPGPWVGEDTSPTRATVERPLSTTPTPSFSFQPVNDTGNYDRVTAVNDEAEIVGVYRQGGQWSSFTATCSRTALHHYILCPINPSFTTVTFPGAAGTYLNANDNTDPDSYVAGYVNSPSTAGLSCTTCGVLYDESTSKWITKTPIYDQNEGSKANGCAVTELLGINDAKVAVGFYDASTSCQPQAFEEYLFNGQRVFVNFRVPGATSSVATGIDNGDDVVGYATVGGVQEGWYYIDGTYTMFYVNALTSGTQPTAINWALNAILGNYTASGVSNGFLINLSGKFQIPPTTGMSSPINAAYAPIDDGSHGTFVNSITPSYWAISGSYQYDKTTGDIQGFVGNCANCASTTGDAMPRGRAKPRSGLTQSEGSRP
jgi:hypothetical protein